MYIMKAENCFICAKEVEGDKTLIGNIPICLECIAKSDPKNDFEQVRKILEKYKNKDK